MMCAERTWTPEESRKVSFLQVRALAPSLLKAALRHTRGNNTSSAQHAATSRLPLIVYKCRISHCKSLATHLHYHHPSTNEPQTPHPTAAMATGLLFVTSPTADYKTVNLLLHNLQDWEYSKGDLNFHLITTKNAYDLELPPGSTCLETTPPALDATFDNGWAGASLKDVEGFCLDMIHSDEMEMISPGLFVVVDEAGFEKREAILCERDVKEPEDDEGEFEDLDSFAKMRVPWSELHSCWCNLNIANMGFDEFGERREDGDGGGEVVDGTGAEGWHDFNTDVHDEGLGEKEAKRKEKALKKLEKEGRV
jgi:hypothetical protein